MNFPLYVLQASSSHGKLTKTEAAVVGRNTPVDIDPESHCFQAFHELFEQ